MKFNDTASQNGLCQDTDFLVNTNTAKYPLADKARSATEWVKKVASWIWESTGDWEFDDKNYSTLPVANRDLTDGAQDIPLPTTVFTVSRLEVQDSSGNYQLLTPIDKSQIKNQAMPEHLKTPGLPKQYDLVGSSIVLYPPVSADDVTLTNALRLYLDLRDIQGFSATDTDKEPGFSEYFHRVVSIGMAMDYALAKGFRDKVVDLKRLLYGDPNVPNDKGLKGELQKSYGHRHRDFKAKLRINVDNRI